MERKDVVRTSGLLDKYLFVRPYETLSVCLDLGVLIQDFQDILCRRSNSRQHFWPVQLRVDESSATFKFS